MVFSIIYSRDFLIKIHSWPKNLEKMAFEAANHIAQDPDLDDYKRSYLTPYRQKHPTTDHQYTLYFLVIPPNEIFIVWINDSSCLHTTRANYQDPCQKEFDRLKRLGQLETFDPNIHYFKFQVNPNKKKPIQCRSLYLNHEVTLNSYFDGTAFVGHAFYCDDPVEGISIRHVSLFLNELHQHLNQNNINLQIQFTKMGHSREILLITESYDYQQWEIVDDAEDFILKKI